MELYIQIINDQPVNHPILKENLLQAFPDIDLENNTDFVPFERVQQPVPGPYVKSITNHYGVVGNVIKDIWTVELLSDSEILQKQQQVKEQWEQTGFTSWIFDEDTCNFIPPIPYPNDGNRYKWNENIKNWEVLTTSQ